jgi:hypothetical protein
MAIDRMIQSKRRGVAWFGSAVPNDGKTAFEERGFQVRATPCQETDLQNNDFALALAAVVFPPSIFAKNPNPRFATPALGKRVSELLDADCRVIIVSDGSWETLRDISIALRADGIPQQGDFGFEGARADNENSSRQSLPHVFVCPPTVAWNQVANRVLEHPPGPPPSKTLRIEPQGIDRDWPAGYDALVRRAFWNCLEVHLRFEPDGRSGVRVYLAYPVVQDKNHGLSHPLPYFVKIGDRQRVFEEYVNYQDRVDPYIPFHLGPHLEPERCCLGCRNGIIVGDFIEQSESLAHCARSGRASTSIAGLFNRTLVGWHRTAQPSAPANPKSTLGEFPRPRDGGGREGLRTRVSLAKRLGATLEPWQLDQLFRRYTPKVFLEGPIHGDLHASNVLVRSNDAIVIDFFAHRRDSLIFEPASLEADLLVSAFEEPSIRRQDQEGRKVGKTVSWMKTIESLYGKDPFAELHTHPAPKNPSCWFHACVRDIRSYAQRIEKEPGQYAAALARALLVKANKDLNVGGPERFRRAAAYVFAERILLGAFGPLPTPGPGTR